MKVSRYTVVYPLHWWPWCDCMVATLVISTWIAWLLHWCARYLVTTTPRSTPNDVSWRAYTLPLISQSSPTWSTRSWFLSRFNALLNSAPQVAGHAAPPVTTLSNMLQPHSRLFYMSDRNGYTNTHFLRFTLVDRLRSPNPLAQPHPVYTYG